LRPFPRVLLSSLLLSELLMDETRSQSSMVLVIYR